ALASGHIAPTTPEQVHFLQVVRGEVEAQTFFERVWTKLRNQQRELDSSPIAQSWHADRVAEAQVGHKENSTKFQELIDVRRYVEEIRQKMEAERAEVLTPVQAQLAAIETKYAQRIQEANEAIAELESEIKAEVLQLGQTVRMGDVQAIFYRGRVTWDSKGLSQYAQLNPEVQQFRKIGAPSVAIRYRKL